MIASIITLFILLKYFPASLTNLIVEQRVVVEVLSMGFLLVTVIILGSAKLIEGEGLAGLLGTIAGYIFARKTADLVSAGQADRSTAALRRQLLHAELEVVDASGELQRLKADAGTSPTKSQASKVARAEEKLERAKGRAQALKDAQQRGVELDSPSGQL